MTSSNSSASSNLEHWPYRLGCPVWATSSWVGPFFTTSDRAQWLGEYSSVFNTVEGNSTFYALPALEVVENWARRAAFGFAFCLKFPRVISHDLALRQAEAETERFCERLEILRSAGVLGPAFLQLGPRFDASCLGDLQRYLERWPGQFPLAVEVRHRDFFDESVHERRLDACLAELGVDRVLFDSRCLFSRGPDDDAEAASQRRKPRSPYRTTITGRRPMVRFVGRNRIELCQPWIETWADEVATWIQEGLRPIVFTHAPDDCFAPQFARRFHETLRKRLPSLPPLPTEPARRGPQQLELF